MNETVKKDDIRSSAGLKCPGDRSVGNEDGIDSWARELSVQIIGYASNVLKKYGGRQDSLSMDDVMVMSKGMVFCLLVLLEKEFLNLFSIDGSPGMSRIRKEFSDSLYCVFFQKDARTGAYEYFKSLFDNEYKEFRGMFSGSVEKATVDDILKGFVNNELKMVVPGDRLKEAEKEITHFFEKYIITQLSSFPTP